MSGAAAPARSGGLVTVRRVAELREAVRAWRSDGAGVGYAPTMGALHAGHLALIRQAQAECRRVIASIFVNPMQFNEQADLESYPREQARDAAQLAAAGVDLLFAPDVAEMYPAGFSTSVSVAGLTDCLCGLTRPGHLTGVATVVTKLLLQALPDVAYFGEKDYQQLLVVRRLARDLDIPVRIAAVTTVRAPDGLALSSRNDALDAEQRRRAPALYRVLSTLAGTLADGAPAAERLAAAREELLAAGFEKVDYLELRDGETLAALERAQPGARLFAAAWLGKTRLIDNLPIPPR